MSNRRRLKAPATPLVRAERGILKAGLIVDPQDPIDTTVQLVFRRPTFGDLGSALKDGEVGSLKFTATVARRTYLRTETITGQDLILSWEELLEGALGQADDLGRIRGHQASSNLVRVLSEVAAFGGLAWDGAGG